jgi:hypothetical protein
VIIITGSKYDHTDEDS